MSRSCQRATSCNPASRLERTTRARPLIVSAEIGLRLWGIADEPFWPGLNPSSTSPTSVRCRCRSSTAIVSHVAAVEAHAHNSSAWRSRAITWVAGTGVSPSASPTNCSTAGSMLEYVPTAPDSLHTATAAVAASKRLRSRSSCSAQSADLGAERRRLGVDAVRASDHHRVAVGTGQPGDRGDQPGRDGRRAARRRRASPSTTRCRRRRTR